MASKFKITEISDRHKERRITNNHNQFKIPIKLPLTVERDQKKFYREI